MEVSGSYWLRFWSKVSPISNIKGCWLWAGDTTNGYGRAWYNGRNLMAHRVAYELAVGLIPAGKVLMHRCDTPLCVRPDHLTPGTQAENMADRAAKGRANSPSGERHYRAKLDNERVRHIKIALELGGLEHQDIAIIYGVSKTTISEINTGIRWAHV